jgi:hypothetical protein
MTARPAVVDLVLRRKILSAQNVGSKDDNIWAKILGVAQIDVCEFLRTGALPSGYPGNVTGRDEFQTDRFSPIYDSDGGLSDAVETISGQHSTFNDPTLCFGNKDALEI